MSRQLIIVVIAFCGICFNYGVHSSEHLPLISEVPSETHFLGLPTRSELPALKNSAMMGSGEDAVRLASWYLKFPQGDDTHLKWTNIAAENGNPIGQFNLALRLLENKNDPLAVTRARYWLLASAVQGSILAREELQELDAQVKK